MVIGESARPRRSLPGARFRAYRSCAPDAHQTAQRQLPRVVDSENPAAPRVMDSRNPGSSLGARKILRPSRAGVFPSAETLFPFRAWGC